MRARVAALLCGLGLIVSIASHYWITDRLGVLRAFYPVEAAGAELSMNCSEQAPLWMREALDNAIYKNFSLSNQLVFIDRQGVLHHCESGWQGSMFLSSRLNANHRFRYASITKLFTADAVLRQVAAGNLSLDSRLIDFLPEVTPVDDHGLELITVNHLLMHSAGFDRLRTPDPMAMHGIEPWCPGDLRSLSRTRLDFAPGERHAYSNLGYCLLGVILERVTGTPYREWVDAQYALSSAGIRFVNEDYYDDEVRYDFRNSNFYDENYSRYFDLRALSSSAGLSGSAVALATTVDAMLARSGSYSLLSGKIEPDCDRSILRNCYGYAFYQLKRANSALELNVQPGFLFGVSSLLMADNKGGLIVWLGNGMPRSGMVGDQMTEFLYGELVRYYRLLDNA